MSKLLAVAKARASVSALVGGCCCCCGGGVSSCACCARSITRLLTANLSGSRFRRCPEGPTCARSGFSTIDAHSRRPGDPMMSPHGTLWVLVA
jgi:hypothetical protein